MRHMIRSLESQMQRLRETLEKYDRAIGEISSIKLQLQTEKRKGRKRLFLLGSLLLASNAFWVFVLCICLHN